MVRLFFVVIFFWPPFYLLIYLLLFVFLWILMWDLDLLLLYNGMCHFSYCSSFLSSSKDNFILGNLILFSHFNLLWSLRIYFFFLGSRNEYYNKERFMALRAFLLSWERTHCTTHQLLHYGLTRRSSHKHPCHFTSTLSGGLSLMGATLVNST